MDAAPPDGAWRAYVPLLRKLLTLYPQFARLQPQWRSGYENVGHIAHGWYLRCHRGVEALLRLEQAGYAEEAAPIRRSIIEHALALRWLSKEGDNILDTLKRGHARDAERIGETVVAAGWTSIDPAQVRRVITDLDPDSLNAANDQFLLFRNRVAGYGDAHVWPQYLAENGRSHPSYESAIPYYDPEHDQLTWHGRAAVPQAPFATTHVLEALIALREAFEPQPWKAELEDILVHFRLANDESRREQGLPPIDWYTGKIREF